MNKELSQTNTPSNFIFFKNYSDYLTSKNILYEKLEMKVNLFENCLHEVGLYKSYPFIDITRFRIFRAILPDSFKITPTDQTEEILMRNCVKREILKYNTIKSLLFKK